MGFNYRLILLLLISSSAMGQSLAPSGNYNTLSVFNGGTKSTRAMIAPKGFQPWATYDTTGFIWLDTVNHFLYYHNGTSRVQVGAGGGGSGTVTNVSTGFGMLGGPITTTGTVRVDSNVIMTLARGYKVSDSVAGVASTSLADSMTVARDSVVKRVPYRYANDTVLLGEYPISAGQFRFDLTPTMPTVVGGMYWDTGNVTVSLSLNADVNLQIGQESLVRARNNTGSTVTNGQVVYIAGAQGNNPTIGLADADSAATSQVIGVATEDIADNGTGFVTVSGVVNDVNTSSWNAGDKLYLSTTNGQLTNTPPTSPHISVMVGTALNSTNNGRIFVSPSQPIATDTNLLNGTNVPPTQYAVKSYVLNRLADTAAAIRAAIPSVAGYATTAALADSVSGRVKYDDTVGMSNRISLLNTLQGASIASADTINLLTATGNIVDVTGTTTIRGLSTSASANSALIGARRVIRFTGALTLTYNATTNILPGSANITTVSGDMAEFIYLGGVSWVCMNYTTRNVSGTGNSVKSASPTFTGSTSVGSFVQSGASATFSNSTGNWTGSFGSGATASGFTKTVNIGTGGAAGSTTNITIGATAGTSTTTLNGTVTVANVSTVSGAVVSNTGTQTLTNKRITYRNTTAASYTTSVTIASDIVDMFIITAQAGALLFNAPSGTPTEGQQLIIRIKDNGTARALTWNAIWRSGDVTLPTTTTLGKVLYMQFIYNSTDTKWDIVGKSDNY